MVYKICTDGVKIFDNSIGIIVYLRLFVGYTTGNDQRLTDFHYSEGTTGGFHAQMYEK